MKRTPKSQAGVTLLEIMLVLAIASMVVLMSVRYYKAASTAQQATALLEQVQTITAAGDSLAQGASGYAAATTDAITAILGGQTSMNTPWGAISISSTNATGYVVAFPTLPTGVAASVCADITASSKFTTCTVTGYTYTGNAT